MSLVYVLQLNEQIEFSNNCNIISVSILCVYCMIIDRRDGLPYRGGFLHLLLEYYYKVLSFPSFVFVNI